MDFFTEEDFRRENDFSMFSFENLLFAQKSYLFSILFWYISKLNEAWERKFKRKCKEKSKKLWLQKEGCVNFCLISKVAEGLWFTNISRRSYCRYHCMWVNYSFYNKICSQVYFFFFSTVIERTFFEIYLNFLAMLKIPQAMAYALLAGAKPQWR